MSDSSAKAAGFVGRSGTVEKSRCSSCHHHPSRISVAMVVTALAVGITGAVGARNDIQTVVHATTRHAENV